jgi:hypothetical protein
VFHRATTLVLGGTTVKLKIVIVLLAALAIETVNFVFLAPPIDVGYPPNTPWYIQSIGLEWVVLHAMGLFSLDWFERVVSCQQLNIVMGCRRVDTFVLFASGYLTTTLLLSAVSFGVQRFLRWKRKRFLLQKLGAEVEFERPDSR